MAIFLKVYFTDFTTTLEDSIVGKNENKSEVSEAFLERRKNKPHPEFLSESIYLIVCMFLFFCFSMPSLFFICYSLTIFVSVISKKKINVSHSRLKMAKMCND